MMHIPFLLALLTLMPVAHAQSAGSGTEAAHDAHTGPAMNYRRVGDRLASSGHFTEGGLERLAREGVQLIVELRPEPPHNQRQRVTAHGIDWAHVPMDWKAPRAKDFEAFSRVVEANAGRHTLIQCAANFRASSMTFLHRVIHLGTPVEEARVDLLAVWEPNATWQRFIDDTLAAHGH